MQDSVLLLKERKKWKYEGKVDAAIQKKDEQFKQSSYYNKNWEKTLKIMQIKILI